MGLIFVCRRRSLQHRVWGPSLGSEEAERPRSVSHLAFPTMQHCVSVHSCQQAEYLIERKQNKTNNFSGEENCLREGKRFIQLRLPEEHTHAAVSWRESSRSEECFCYDYKIEMPHANLINYIPYQELSYTLFSEPRFTVISRQQPSTKQSSP